MSDDLPSAVELRPTRLLILPGISFDEWSAAWESLDQTNRSLNWAIGDCLAYGETYFPDQWSNALAPEYVEQYARCLRVSTLIPPAERRENFSWSAHREVSALSPEERAEVLDLAEAQGWRSREIRDEVQRRKAVRKGNGGPPIEAPDESPEGNSTWNALDDENTFGDPMDVEGAQEPLQNGYANGAPDAPSAPNGISAPAQGDEADYIRAIIAAVRRLAPALSDEWRMEGLRVDGKESTVKLVRGGRLAIGQGPSLPCALVEAACAALLSDLGAG